MDRFRQDLRFAVRGLRRSPVFAVTVLATLALGIGANTAIFSFVDALLLRPLPYPEPDRLVTIWQDYTETGGPEQEWFTPPDFADVREHASTIEAVTLIDGFGATLTNAGEPVLLNGGLVSVEWFDVVGVTPALGRGFAADDGQAGDVVVLSHTVWRDRFGGDTAVVGGTITLNGNPTTVIGVMPQGFESPIAQADLWAPATASTYSGCGRGCYVMRVIGRLAQDATVAQAEAELAGIARSIVEQAPAVKAGMQFRVIGLHALIAGPAEPALLALLGAVGLLLLIACVNIANLLLARAGTREREVAVRSALGAGRRRLMRQLMTESVVLGVAGGALGVLLSLWGVRLLVGMTPPGTPRLDEVAIDLRVLGFAAALSIVTGVLFGLVPAAQLARTRLTSALRDGERTTAARHRMRGALVVAEIALALMLLVGAGLLVRSFVRLQTVDPGFAPENVMTASLLMPPASYESPAQFNPFYSELLDRLSARPGVVTAGASSILPMSGGDSDIGFLIEGRPMPADRSEAPVAWYRSISADYFRAMGMRLVQGRGITAEDRADAPPVVVINETLARRHWPNENPVGQRITSEGPEGPWTTVVGVVADVRDNGLDAPPQVEMFLPYQQVPSRFMNFVLRTETDPQALAPAVRAEVQRLDPNLPVTAIGTMRDLVRTSTAMPRLYLSFFGFFAGVALVLAAVGIYGITAYTVTQRTQEIGIRMALGARQGDVLRLVLRHAVLLVAAGVVLGVAGALALSRQLSALLYDLSPTDPATFATIALILAGVALAASVLPALRAARIDPQVALRSE